MRKLLFALAMFFQITYPTRPGGSPGNIEINNAGAFGGLPGSSSDATNGYLTLAPTGSLANPTLTLIGDSAGGDILDLDPNGTTSPTCWFSSNGVENCIEINILTGGGLVFNASTNLTDVTGSTGTTGQFLSAGPSGGSVLWATPTSSFTPSIVWATKTGNYTFVNGDNSKAYLSADSSNDVYTMPSPTGSTFTNGWYVWVKNGSSTSTVTFTPAGSTTIDGQSTLVAQTKAAFLLVSDGTNYHSLVISPTGNNAGNLVFASPNGASGAPNMRALVATDLPGGSIANSVSNSDGTLTISPTTGAVVASLALGHANTWTGTQTFGTITPTTISGAANFSGTPTFAAGAGLGTGTFTGAATLSGNLTLSGQDTFSNSPGASQSAITVSGAPYAGGTATTNFPLVYLNGGAAPTTLHASGTEFGINAPSGFGGNFIDVHANGGGSLFVLSSVGAITMNGGINIANGNKFSTGNRATLSSPTDGQFVLLNNAGTAFTALEFGGTSSSFVSLQSSGTTLTVGTGSSGGTGNFVVTGTTTTAGTIQTAAAPTVAASQVGFGGTTAVVANCGVTGPTACLVINVAGTTRYIPYY